jgi:hypothetical protein
MHSCAPYLPEKGSCSGKVLCNSGRLPAHCRCACQTWPGRCVTRSCWASYPSTNNVLLEQCLSPFHSCIICELLSPSLCRLLQLQYIRLPGMLGVEHHNRAMARMREFSDATTVYCTWFKLLSEVQACGARCCSTAAHLLPCRSGRPAHPSPLGFISTQVLRICHTVSNAFLICWRDCAQPYKPACGSSTTTRNEEAVLLRTCRWQPVNMRACFSMISSVFEWSLMHTRSKAVCAQVPEAVRQAIMCQRRSGLAGQQAGM